MIEVVNAEMLRALRVVSVERGLDPRDFALVAFGGAGPLHACALADELGIGPCSCPRRPASSPRSGSPSTTSGATPCARSSSRSTAGELPAEGEADLRYRGQSFELTVPLGADVAESFHRAHEERYGYADRGRAARARRVRTADVRPGPAVEPARRAPAASSGRHRLELEGSTAWIPRVGGG